MRGLGIHPLYPLSLHVKLIASLCGWKIVLSLPSWIPFSRLQLEHPSTESVSFFGGLVVGCCRTREAAAEAGHVNNEENGD